MVRAFVGHGIGEQFHTDLMIPHYDDPSATIILVPGMTFTVEPMITVGVWTHRRSGTTAGPPSRPTSGAPPSSSTPCSSRRAGVEILTLADGEPQPFAH